MLYDIFMKISIVTASYNYEKYIKETIHSILNQTYKDWEMIIVDDCSTDNSVDVIKSYNDDRIKLFVNEKNLGLKETLKHGIKEANSEWIAFLESDDVLAPDYLEKKVEIIKKYPDINLIFNDCEFFGDDERVKAFEHALKKTRDLLKNQSYPKNMFYDFYQSNKIFTFSSVMAKRRDLLKVNFNPKLDYLIDWHLWVQLASLGKFYYMPEKLTKWRLHNNSYINSSTYKSPVDLQTASYLEVFKAKKDISILIFILLSHPVWYARKYKRELRQTLISYKRKAFPKKKN